MSIAHILNIPITTKIKNFVDAILTNSNVVIFNINIPKNILCRTELLCEYVEEEHDYTFDLNNFLMLLYLDFLKNSVKTYNPEKLFKLLTKDFSKSDILLTNGIDSCNVKRSNCEYTNITITIERKDFNKGQLILDELYDLYKYRVTFSHLIEALWLDFIECYKNGTQKRAYYSIIKLLKDCFE